MSTSFIRDSIESKLAELRKNCALEKEGLRHATDPKSYWGDDSGGSTYWADLKAKCAVDRKASYEQSLVEMAEFIADHREIMGADWIDNDHGRLCWNQYIGGFPIDCHYCIESEGHAGHHHDMQGSWR